MFFFSVILARTTFINNQNTSLSKFHKTLQKFYSDLKIGSTELFHHHLNYCKILQNKIK